VIVAPAERAGVSRSVLAVAATSLTSTRLALAVPLAVVMADDDAVGAAAAILAVGIATDVLDGRAARAAGAAGPKGQAFDHATDCVFVAAGLGGAATRDAVPWLLPVLVVGSFVQYAADSRGRTGLRGTRLGRCNGVLYFVVLAADLLARGGLLSPGAVRVLAVALVGSTLVSMAQRWRYVIRTRRSGTE
jgi:phosphatidylglycerophosphate synthase